MATILQHLDLNLCRQILFRTMEVMARDAPRGPDNYEFDGYGPEMVDYNIRKLHDHDFIRARERTEKQMGAIGCWPDLLYDRGLAFIEMIRDDEVWQEALRAIEARGQMPTLKKVRVELLRIAGR